MGRKSRPTFKKRQKEIARQQRQRDKMSRRLAKNEEEIPPAPPGLDNEDPDIAGIRPGPQPLPDEWSYVSNPVPSAAKPVPSAAKPEQKAEQNLEQKAEGES